MRSGNLCNRLLLDMIEILLSHTWLLCLADLSFKIIDLYSELVNFVNGDGMTPLHLLASKPSAFKSGCDLPWFENIIYHSKHTIKFSRFIVSPISRKMILFNLISLHFVYFMFTKLNITNLTVYRLSCQCVNR